MHKESNLIKDVQGILICTLLAAVTILLIYSVSLVRTTTDVISYVPNQVEAVQRDLVGQISEARKDLTNQIAVARQETLTLVNNQATGIRKEVTGQLTHAQTLIADRSESLIKITNNRLGEVSSAFTSTADAVVSVQADLKPTLANLSSTTTQVNDNLPMFLDCDHNPDCVFNRYVGVSKGVEKAAQNVSTMSGDFRAALPQFITTWQGIGKQTDGIATNINKLTTPKWYDRLLGYGLNGVMIYRNLNPTSITVKAASIISSRP